MTAIIYIRIELNWNWIGNWNCVILERSLVRNQESGVTQIRWRVEGGVLGSLGLESVWTSARVVQVPRNYLYDMIMMRLLVFCGIMNWYEIFRAGVLILLLCKLHFYYEYLLHIYIVYRKLKYIECCNLMILRVNRDYGQFFVNGQFLSERQLLSRVVL